MAVSLATVSILDRCSGRHDQCDPFVTKRLDMVDRGDSVFLQLVARMARRHNPPTEYRVTLRLDTVPVHSACYVQLSYASLRCLDDRFIGRFFGSSLGAPPNFSYGLCCIEYGGLHMVRAVVSERSAVAGATPAPPMVADVDN